MAWSWWLLQALDPPQAQETHTPPTPPDGKAVAVGSSQRELECPCQGGWVGFARLLPSSFQACDTPGDVRSPGRSLSDLAWGQGLKQKSPVPRGLLGVSRPARKGGGRGRGEQWGSGRGHLSQAPACPPAWNVGLQDGPLGETGSPDHSHLSTSGSVWRCPTQPALSECRVSGQDGAGVERMG